MQTILFFGDSLTAGYGLRSASDESLPALIQQKIHAAGMTAKVVNAGISGDTTSGGLARIDRVLNQPVDIFVLELGINDAFRNISPQISLKNLQAIIDKVKAKYPKVKLALLGMEIPIFLRGDLAEEFRAIFRQLAAVNNMAFVPFMLSGVAGKKHLNLADRLHPSAEGYKIIADNVWPVIKSLVLSNES
ncbi:MAG: arylesterase [Mucilaginibacter sp.]|nr:arylesterase [Mucilaginibacter sp.]MDB5111274.1 arylesterase [Mucilaginibacter sp.]